MRDMGKKPRLVLASASPRRRELLSQLGLDFVVCPSDFDESSGNLPEEPEALVRFLASMKAREVARSYPDRLVLGVDTVVALPGRILQKPEGPDEAVRMLQDLSDGWHSVYSGMALVQFSSGREEISAVKTDVHFLALSDSEIRAYVNTGEALDKAGAYGIQGQAAVFVDEISGCYFNVVGLPLARLAQMLKKFGIQLP
jgi:septum formation protein